MPTIDPTSVICATFAARAMPKSVTLSRPSSVRIMLWGLMSRWTTPWRWANSSASSAWTAQFTTSASGSGARLVISSFRVGPFRYSIAM